MTVFYNNIFGGILIWFSFPCSVHLGNKPNQSWHMEVTLLHFSQVHAIIGNQSIVEICSQSYDLALCLQLLLKADVIMGPMKKLFIVLINVLLKTLFIILFNAPTQILAFYVFLKISSKKIFYLLMIIFGLFLIIFFKKGMN